MIDVKDVQRDGNGFFPIITLGDGIQLSIQAGRGLYCHPKINMNRLTEYSDVEIGFPSRPVKELEKHAEAYNDVYPCVPIDVVFRIIENHGGIARTGEWDRHDFINQSKNFIVRYEAWARWKTIALVILIGLSGIAMNVAIRNVPPLLAAGGTYTTSYKCVLGIVAFVVFSVLMVAVILHNPNRGPGV